MVEPLFKSEGSVYRRRPSSSTVPLARVEDDDDEDWVDRSIPSTPLNDRFEDPLGAAPGPSSFRARSETPIAIYEGVKREHSPGPGPEVTVKDESPEEGRDRDDTPPLREIDSDDLEELDAPPEDERQCRICFAGKEEEGTMGRLISPCLCTGSVRYVHVSCINAWRGSGSNAKAFIECQQCHYHYHFRRTLISGLATSRPIILLSTFILFASLTLFAGQAMTWLLSIPAFHNRVLEPPSSKYVFLGDDNEWYELDDSSVIYVSGGGTLMWDIVIGAVRTFATVANRLSHSKGNGGVWGMMPPAAQWVALRSLMGLAVLGSFSFLSLLLSLSLFGPLQLANGLRGAGLLGNWSRRRRGTGTGVGQYMMIAIVIIGSINTLISVYGTVETLTQRILKYVETQILEVNPEDRRKAKEERAEVWWKRWIRERRYRTRNGWEEVWARLLIRARIELRGMKRRWEVWKDSMVHGLDHEVDERI